MIDVEEHIYSDDPNEGHADVRTRLKDASYFFLGNGMIQTAIQIAPSGEGSPIGLVFMNPEQLKSKRESLSFDPENGFANTMIRLQKKSNQNEISPKNISAVWNKELGVPAVHLQWKNDAIHVREIIYCPDKNNPIIIREVHFENNGRTELEFIIKTGIKQNNIKKQISLLPENEEKLFIEYSLNKSENKIDLEFIPEAVPTKEAIDHWKKTTNISFAENLLDRFFDGSRFQLNSAISKTGVVDASIWQYNREWVRDHSFMTIGLILSGEHELAKVLLERLINDFVCEDGDCIDSSEKRDPDEVELDQNGILVYTIKTYVLWTGDFALVKKYWGKIVKIVEFPLKDVFRHEESGMFYNSREYWERHSVYGIKPGIELMYQFFPSLGLTSAAILARIINKNEDAKKWDAEALRLKNAILNHPTFSLVDKRGFIKRRDIDGSIQETITPLKDAGLPDGVPLTENMDHFLNPDTCAALPIAFRFVPPDSEIARATLENLEMLWNQRWEDGGYGRYHFASEADSYGAWPFPSLFIARACIETGDYNKVWKILNWMNSIPGAISGSWFEMYGSRISPPYAQVGITPWTWGEIIMLMVHHIVGIQLEEENIRIRPRLLPGLKEVAGSLPIRKNRLSFKYIVDQKKLKAVFDVNVPFNEFGENEILIPYSNEDIIIEAFVPQSDVV